VLIGDAGVGKTAIVEAFAVQLLSPNLPSLLQGKRLVSLNVADLLAGAKLRGQFEDRVGTLVSELSQSDEVILFIDELHTLIGAGAIPGSLDAAHLFKPALGRGDIRCIGATTLAEYHRWIESDPALARRFQPIAVEEPTEPQTLRIVRALSTGEKSRWRDVNVADEATEAAVRLTSRFIRGRAQPAKAIAALDQASAHARLRTYLEESKRNRGPIPSVTPHPAHLPTAQIPLVTVDDVAEVVSRWSGVRIPRLLSDERSELRELPLVLARHVFGQDHAVEVVGRAIRRARLGLNLTRGPEASFLFIGPTGVGKAHLAHVLARQLYGDERALLRFNMSEYSESHSPARLVGAPPGYAGHDIGGQLTEGVRRRPACVLLFDGVEMAHPEVCHLLAQLIQRGTVTDGRGVSTDLSNALVVITMEISAGVSGTYGGPRDYPPYLGAGAARYETGRAVPHLFRLFETVDEVVTFNPLDRETAASIATLLVSRAEELINARYRIPVRVKEEVRAKLLEEGFNDKLGVSRLAASLRRWFIDPIAEAVIRTPASSQDLLELTVTTTGEPYCHVLFPLPGSRSRPTPASTVADVREVNNKRFVGERSTADQTERRRHPPANTSRDRRPSRRGARSPHERELS
jgi:ATP-dependent Clp protease ATP-binding subunit ClpC